MKSGFLEVPCIQLSLTPLTPQNQLKRIAKMAKPNYEYAKRQRDLAKKQKKEAKLKLKAEAKNPPAQEEEPPQPPADEKTET
jgi:hypothetical protein